MSRDEAQLSEIFSSFQGEGLYIGAKQVFIRFAGCNLSCRYCDTPQALELKPNFKYEAMPGLHKFETRKNPVSADELVSLVHDLDKPGGTTHSICLTGGEPLLQVNFIKVFLPLLKPQLNLPIHLETNGVLPEYLAEVIELVDVIAMDIKLPSATGLSPYWKEHRKALGIAGLREVFVKIVITRETRPADMIEAVNLVAGINVDIPLVIQPVTAHGRPEAEQLFAFFAMAQKKLKTVRVIPQGHKLLGIS